MSVALTMPGGKHVQMLGSARHFFRLVDLFLDPETFEQTRAAGLRELSKTHLDNLRRAVNIEGPSAEMFGLLRALVLGPVEEAQ